MWCPLRHTASPGHAFYSYYVQINSNVGTNHTNNALCISTYTMMLRLEIALSSLKWHLKHLCLYVYTALEPADKKGLKIWAFV
jgi:hypothetical protein